MHKLKYWIKYKEIWWLLLLSAKVYRIAKGGLHQSTFDITEQAFTLGGYVTILNNPPEIDINRYNHRLETKCTKEFNYIWAPDGRDELYNIRRDSTELDNLIDIKAEKAVELKALLIE